MNFSVFPRVKCFTALPVGADATSVSSVVDAMFATNSTRFHPTILSPDRAQFATLWLKTKTYNLSVSSLVLVAGK